MNDFTIRFAKREDSAEILRFIKAIAEYEKMSDEVEGSVLEVESTLFDKNQAEVLLAEENGKAVGFALFFHNYSTFKARHGLYLEDLYVDSDMRGKGYGKALLLELAKIANQRGCGRMEWCCLDWNKPSIEFYKGLGAVPMDTWTTYRLDGNRLLEFAKYDSGL